MLLRFFTNPVEVEIITPDNIPGPTREYEIRSKVVQLRRIAIKNTYIKAVPFLSLSILFLSFISNLPGALAGAQLSEDNVPFFLQVIPIEQVLLLVLTFILLLNPESKTALFLKKLFRAAVTRMTAFPFNLSDEPQKLRSIRLVWLQIVAGLWAFIAIQNIFINTTPSKTTGILFILASLSTVAGYYFWIHKKAGVLERKYPYYRPFNLLALRVFGGSSLADFLQLSNAWQWIGTRQRLDGPDTTGRKTRDLIHFFTGQIEKSIVKNSFELNKAVQRFRMLPDSELRFPVNSMQCNNATWKDALEKLLELADVVVLDLSDLSEKKPGDIFRD